MTTFDQELTERYVGASTHRSLLADQQATLRACGYMQARRCQQESRTGRADPGSPTERTASAQRAPGQSKLDVCKRFVMAPPTRRGGTA
jgi:hypothetical protein